MDQAATRAMETPGVIGFVSGLGSSMLTLDAMVAEISRTDMPVLIVGESGTGKDTYARYIHRLSQRQETPFWKINCSAVKSDGLLAQINKAQSLLAKQELSGSIYLDNLQELDSACQRVLLAQIPDTESSGCKRGVQVRFLSSTIKHLLPELDAGRFRRELYFRLNGTCLHLPPLRERKEDIPALLDHFLHKYGEPAKRHLAPLEPEVLEKLTGYRWPGNIRELENVARKLAVFGNIEMALHDLPAVNLLKESVRATKPSFLKTAARAASQQAERQLIRQALERTRWNRKRAARELQISYKSLLYKIKQIGPLNGEPEE
jgi:two-component system, NtrC family, response regulator AtoC